MGEGGGDGGWAAPRPSLSPPPPPHCSSHPPHTPPPTPPSPLAASFSIFQPTSYHLIVTTTFGLKLQIQLVPVMQLFLTLDQAAQGRVQGEWSCLAPPCGCPRASVAPALPNLVPAPQASAGTSTASKGTTSRRLGDWWRPRAPALPTPGRSRRAARTSWTGWTTPAPSTSRAVRLGRWGPGPGETGLPGGRGGWVRCGRPAACCLPAALRLAYSGPWWQPAEGPSRGPANPRVVASTGRPHTRRAACHVRGAGERQGAPCSPALKGGAWSGPPRVASAPAWATGKRAPGTC